MNWLLVYLIGSFVIVPILARMQRRRIWPWLLVSLFVSPLVASGILLFLPRPIRQVSQPLPQVDSDPHPSLSVACPHCDRQTDVSPPNSKRSRRYFLGLDKSRLPVFKCQWCGEPLVFDYANRLAFPFSRPFHATRAVPIIWGIITLGLAATIFWFWWNTLVLRFLGILVLLNGANQIRIGLFANRKVIDEMALDRWTELSQTSEEELDRFR